MIVVDDKLTIDEGELREEFVRASGPGGQNVNKVSSAVQLYFDVRHSPSLPEDVKHRLERLAGKRLTDEGVLIIQASRYRTQEQNREDARRRLAELVREAAVPPRTRKRTRPTATSREKRLEQKRRLGRIKSLRQLRPHETD